MSNSKPVCMIYKFLGKHHIWETIMIHNNLIFMGYNSYQAKF